jgi:hypothetical protein
MAAEALLKVCGTLAPGPFHRYDGDMDERVPGFIQHSVSVTCRSAWRSPTNVGAVPFPPAARRACHRADPVRVRGYG